MNNVNLNLISRILMCLMFGVSVFGNLFIPGKFAGSVNYVKSIEEKNFKVVIAGAGGAAHLAGVIAAHTLIPVLGVPMKSSSLDGLDSLLSTVQMPSGIPVATFGIGNPGASNAALMAVSILSLDNPDLKNKLIKFRENKAKAVLESELT